MKTVPCKRCGKPAITEDKRHGACYCDACRREKKKEWHKAYWERQRAKNPIPETLTKTCTVCGQSFVTSKRHPHAQYCPTCRNERAKEQRLKWQHKNYKPSPERKNAQCTVCGKNFTVSKYAHDVRYCPDCRQAKLDTATKLFFERRRSVKELKSKTFTCKQCGKPIDRTKKNSLYCPECRRERELASKRRYNAKTRVHKLPDMKPVTCTVCGETFEVYKTVSNVLYCPACRKKKNVEQSLRSMENHGRRVPKEERDRIQAERRLEQERKRQELEALRLEQERQEKERLEQQRLEAERQRQEQERIEQERLEREHAEQERLEQERRLAAQQEQQRKQQLTPAHARAASPLKRVTRGGFKTFMCELCGKPFETYANVHNAKFCPKCKQKAASIRAHHRYMKKLGTEERPATAVCVDCGKTFDIPKHGSISIYCPECRKKRNIERQRLYAQRKLEEKRLSDEEREARRQERITPYIPKPMEDPWMLGRVYSGADPEIAGMCQLYG